MKPENQLIASVHKWLDPAIYREKTANPYRRGMPDVYYEAQGTVLWAEYKWFPRETSRAVDLRNHLTPNQQAWLERAHGHGIPVAVIVGCPRKAALLGGLSWQLPSKIDWLPRSEVVAQLHQRLLPGGIHATTDTGPRGQPP